MATKKKTSTRFQQSELSGDKKTFILYLNNGKEKRIAVPVEAKITFGPGIPGPRTINQGSFQSNDREYCVRIYVGDKESGLIAVFAGVREFRALDIPCDELVIREAGETMWKSDESGFKHETNVRYEKVAINAPQLTSSED